MKLDYTPEIIQEGRARTNKNKETPSTFGLQEGAVQPKQTGRLDKGNPRLAGIEGNRALQLINDPMEGARTQKWMSAFGLSNDGVKWNMGRLGIPPTA